MTVEKKIDKQRYFWKNKINDRRIRGEDGAF